VITPLASWSADAERVAVRPAPAEVIVVRMILNSEPKGDLFVGRTADLDFLVKVEDLKAMGIKEPPGKAVLLEGEPHMSLRSMTGVSFTFDARQLTLEVLADAKLLPGSAISLASRGTRTTTAPGNSGYVNYALNATGGEPEVRRRLGFAGEAGWRSGNFLFQTDGSTVYSPGGERKFVRLMSSMTHDDLGNLRQTVVGDFFTPSRDLSSGINLGGISVAKVYNLDPYLIRAPMQSISGNVSLPSELEIYLDGHKIRTQQLRPGEFELRDIVAYGGAQSVQLVLRDPFGRVQQLSYSFYFSDQPLQPGLHEYSYNLGAIRRRYGQTSNSYGPAAFNLFHRFGLNRFLTVGLRAEGTRKLTNIGPLATVVLGNAGVVNMALVQSSLAGRSGSAASLGYTYQTRGWTFGATLRHDGRHYAALGDPPVMTNRRYESSVGASYHLPGNGSISLSHSSLNTRSGVDAALSSAARPFNVTLLSARRVTGVTYTAPLLSGRVSFTSSLSHIKDRLRGGRNEIFAGFTFLLDKDHSVAGNFRRERDEHSESLRLVKSQPIGEGLGYSLGADHTSNQGVESATSNTTSNSNIQYNASAAVLRAEYNRSRVQQQTYQDYRLSIAGNISYVGGQTALGRPVTGSFGIAKVGELAGVDVLVDGQTMGRTNSRGKIFLPTLSPYLDNNVSINPASLPIEYSISALSKNVSPSQRGGVLVDFPVMKIQAFTGKLKYRQDGAIRPVEFQEIDIDATGKRQVLQTGRGGEFYIENLKPGTYAATVRVEGKPCLFDIVIPTSGETFVELGDVVCRFSP
jgi:outer membrane usher protein